MFYLLDFCAASIFLVVAVWCVLSPLYDDGIIGKILFSCLALSSYAIVFAPSAPTHDIAHSLMMWSAAGIVVREAFCHHIVPCCRHKGMKQ